MRLARFAAAALLMGSSALAAEPPNATGGTGGGMFQRLGQIVPPSARADAGVSAGPAAADDGQLKEKVVEQAPTNECIPLPKPRAGGLPFLAGETLSYDIDVMGVRAGKMDLEVLPFGGKTSAKDIPVRVRAESNTFFTKVRRVKAEATSSLNQRDLRPRRFVEDLSEGELRRIATVNFDQPGRTMVMEWHGSLNGASTNRVAPDGLDYVGGIYLLRSLPLKIGDGFCFDSYGMRRVWRVEGKVLSREHVSTPAGEFDAFHIAGQATRLGPGKHFQREIHVWISDDERRLPLAALGVIDLGPVRATLTSVTRPDLKTAVARPPKEW